MNATHEITAYGQQANGVIGNYTLLVHAPEADEDQLTGLYRDRARGEGFKLIGKVVITPQHC